MSDKCFEIGALQAFLDGETSPDQSFRMTDHIAVCERCALQLANAEEESAAVFSMLDREFNTMVPTQRLWSSINTAISYEKANTSFWDKIRNSVSILLVNPSLTVAASVLIVFAIFAAVWNLKPATSSIIDNSVAENRGLQPAANQTETVDVVGGNDVIAPSANPGSGYTIKETHLTDDNVAKLARTTEYRSASERPKPERAVVRSIVDPSAPSADAYLPGEETYVRTIADLKQNVDGQKDRIMDPSSRFAYERDMAVVNDAITKMKDVVKKHPNNQAAKQVLYSSYQNKIDLLNSVAGREELMATLR